MIRVVLVDDHDMVRNALGQLLGCMPDIQVVAQASSAQAASEALHRQEADVVVVDLDLAGESGRDFALKLLEGNPAQGVIILSYRVDPGEVQFLVEAGVRGYVPKSANSEELVQAVRSVAAGGHHFAPQAASALAESLRSKSGDRINPLTLRQTLILQHMARGLTTREIAQELCLSPKTVEKYRGEILRKLNSKNQVQALDAARRLGLLESARSQ